MLDGGYLDGGYDYLDGGYDLQALRESSVAHVAALR